MCLEEDFAVCTLVIVFISTNLFLELGFGKEVRCYLILIRIK